MADMTPTQREKWIKELKEHSLRLSDELNSMGDRIKKNGETDKENYATYGQKFNEFYEKVRLYENASKKHNSLLQEGK